MLIQFNFKNFKSFRDDTTLDFSATKISEFNDRVISIGKERILPVAAIYGANASGKSNVYSAYEYMIDYVANSLHFGDDPKEFEEHIPTPFLFDSVSEKAESSFEVYFTVTNDHSGKVYNYGFCVGKEGVTEEWLNYKAKTSKEYTSIFYRSEKELDLSGFSNSASKNISVALDKQVLIISLGAKLKIDKCKLVRDWFIANEFADFGDTIVNLFLSRRLPENFVNNKEVQNKVVKYFSSFDESIVGFDIEEIPSEGEPQKNRYSINSLHKKIDSDELARLPFYSESAGTIKMFSLYTELEDVLRNGSVYFIDELNARLHPLLVRNIILLFLNPEVNVNHAQLIFTTHDTWQLSNQLLRRDEIWFVEKDKDGISTLYSLADFIDEEGTKIRKDASYEKNYLTGKYGAIPTLKKIDLLKEE